MTFSFKKRIISVILILFITPVAYAQYEFSFSGYVVDLPVYQRMNDWISNLIRADRDQFVNVTRLRLRPTLSLWTDARLALEYEATSAYHSTSVLMPLQQEEPRRQVVKLTWQPINESHFSLLHFIDRFTFTQRLGSIEFVLGRQRISLGTGRIWNPTDLFNPLNPTSFAKIEKDGVDAFSTKFFLGEFTDLQLVVNPQKKQHGNAGYRFRTNFEEFDLSTVGGIFDDRLIVGGDFAGNLLDAGVRGELIVSTERENLSSNFTTFILGADYQFTSKLYALVEYHHNGEGKNNRTLYELLRLINGEILNLGRDYLAVQAVYQIHPLVMASISTIGNLNDGSRFFAIIATYSVTENTSLTLGGQIFTGDQFTEYWYYPGSIFLKGEFYF
ncbi:MAG: hypothetical protein ABSB78_01885 [Bacteroidota bacterium]